MNNTMPPPTLSMIAANLLHNSCFLPGYLINQRGAVSGSISNSSSYFIDGWMTYQSALNNLTYTFGSDGLRVAVSTGSGGIGQRLESALETGKSYTLAAQIDGVVYTLQITGGTSCNQNVTSTTTLAYVTDYGGYNAVRIYFTGANARVITWVALYEGAYTAETLPPYVPPDPAVELAKCRRYYQTGSHYFRYPTATAAAGTMYSVTTLQNLNMRTTPTITTQSPKTPNVQNSLRVASGVEDITYTNLGVRYVNGCAVLTFSGISAAYPANAGVEFYWKASAEL